MPMRLSLDGSCAYHCCDQSGHSVCAKVGAWADRLTAAARRALPHLPPEDRAALEAILAEDPDTQTTT